jgi:hypothetical protein
MFRTAQQIVVKELPLISAQLSPTVQWKPEIMLCIMLCLLADAVVTHSPVVGFIEVRFHHILAMGLTWDFCSYLRNGAS